MSKNVRFKEILKKKKISPYYLAEELGVAPQTIYRYIWGDREPSAAIMLKLKKILNISGDEILEMFAEEAAIGGDEDENN